MLASLNKLFYLANWTPESISPSEETSSAEGIAGLSPISVNLAVETDTGTTMTVLSNIERSIREFNIGKATIEWKDNNTLSLQAQANAYYTSPSTIMEKDTTIRQEGN